MNPGYEYRLYDDADIDTHMRTHHPELIPHWNRMKNIEKADLFRYAILYDVGGIYADIDVTCQRPVDEWLRTTGDFFNVDLIVGFEITTTRKDWKKWFARQFQLSQWTMAGHKGHPVFQGIMDKVAHFFATHTDEERKGVSVVQTTGPGPWSDAVLEHLDNEYGVNFGHEGGTTYFTHDRASERFLHIGTVLLLPIRAFSLGSGGYQLKSEHAMDEIFIKHGFKGSWKNKVVSSGFQGDVAHWGGNSESAYDDSKKQKCATQAGNDLVEFKYCSIGRSPDGEGVANVFDGEGHTKWLAFWNFESTRELHKHPEKAPYVTFEACKYTSKEAVTAVNATCSEMAFRAEWYSITSAIDAAKRDPSAWIVEGTLNGLNWTTIDSQANITFGKRTEKRTFTIASPGLFTKYRMSILAIDDPYEANCVQIGDFWLDARPRAPDKPPTCTAVDAGYACMCCGKTPSVEGLDKLFDNSLETKLLLQPFHSTDYGYNITVRTADKAPRAFPVAAYSIGSANDFPARDPASWRLSGKGASERDEWVTIDERSGVVFTDRFQRITFKIGEAGPWQPANDTAATAAPFAPATVYHNYSEYMLTVLTVFDITQVKCSAPKCFQFSEFALHEPGQLPTVPPPTTTTTITTTTTTLPAWDVEATVENWPRTMAQPKKDTVGTDGTFEIRVTPGGFVQWNFTALGNLISGTPSDPTTVFGFIVNRPAGTIYRHQFNEVGDFAFFSSVSRSASGAFVSGVVRVGGPPTTVAPPPTPPVPWPTLVQFGDWPNEPAAKDAHTATPKRWDYSYSRTSAKARTPLLWRARLQPGGTASWNFTAAGNLLSGTPENPTDVFGFLPKRMAGAVYNHTFSTPGTYRFFSSVSGVRGVIEVGGPTTTAGRALLDNGDGAAEQHQAPARASALLGAGNGASAPPAGPKLTAPPDILEDLARIEREWDKAEFKLEATLNSTV